MSEPLTETPAITSVETQIEEDSILHTAVVLYKKEDYQKAINLLLPHFERDKSGVYANFIADCHQKLGAVNDALRFWQKAISQNPTCYQAFVGLGNANYAQNNIKQALIYWHIALSINPENPQINYNLAAAYARKDARLESLFYYEKFLKYAEDTESREFKYVTKIISTLRNKASENIKKASKAIGSNKINIGVQYYIKAIKNYPLIPKVVQNIAKIFYYDRNFKKAIEYYKLALKIDPGLKVCLVDIANAYIASKNYELAYCYFVKFLTSYTERKPSFIELERMATYAKSKFSQNYDPHKHLSQAKEYEKNLEYKNALEEYEIFRLLCDEQQEMVDENIKKLKMMLYPERFIIKRLVGKIEEYNSHARYDEAADLCDRMIILSQLNSREFMWASKKKQEMKYMAYRILEGKKHNE